MKHLKSFESYVTSITEADKKPFDVAGWTKVMNELAHEMAKIDMAIELMADGEDEITEGRIGTANAVVVEMITELLKQNYTPEQLPKVKAFLTTLKKDFPVAAAKGGLEYAAKDLATYMSKLLEFKLVDAKSDISEDATVDQLAKAGKDDIKDGIKAIAAYAKKSIPAIFKKTLMESAEVNENESPLNEGDIYVSSDDFADETSLVADVIKNITPAFNKLLKDSGIDYKIDSTQFNRNRFEFSSKPMVGDKLGIFKYGFKEVWIDSFGGGGIQIQKGEEFKYTPLIWFNLHYTYSHGSADTSSQGSNGCSLFLPGQTSSNVYYDIDNKVFLKYSESEKRFAELHKNAK